MCLKVEVTFFELSLSSSWKEDVIAELNQSPGPLGSSMLNLAERQDRHILGSCREESYHLSPMLLTAGLYLYKRNTFYWVQLLLFWSSVV